VASPAAGTISLSAVYAETPERVVTATLEPGEDGRYPRVNLSEDLYGLETITIGAQGQDVPMFETTVTFPIALFLTNAVVVDPTEILASVQLSRSVDAILTWDRGAAGVIFSVQGFAASQSLVCSFASEQGTGTIPAELLGQFTGDELSFYTATLTDANAGDWELSVQTGGQVVTPDRMYGTKAVLVP
jgi:hypothetical protein